MRSGADARSLFPEAVAIRETFSDPRYLLLFIPLAAGIAFAYVLLLATLALQVTLPYLGLWVLAHATSQELLVGAGIGTLISLLVSLNVYLWRRRVCRPPGLAAAGGTAGLVFNAIGSMICCSTVVPLLLSVFLSGGALASATFGVRGFFSEYSAAFYVLSFLLLWLSVRVVARRFVGSSTLDEEEAIAPDGALGRMDEEERSDLLKGSTTPAARE